MLRQFVTDSLSILRSPRVSTFERHACDDGRTAVAGDADRLGIGP